MKPLSPIFFSMVMTILFLVEGAGAASLREQLEAATADEDSYSQIDLIRRLLDEGPDEALQQRLVTLWIVIADYGMAERELQNWKSAPEGFRAVAEADILLLRDRNRAEALAKLESYHARQPEDRAVTLRLVDVLSGQNDNQRIDEVLTSVPGVENDASLLVRRAKARRSLAEFAPALKDFAAANQIDPEVGADDRPAFERLGVVLPEIDKVTTKLAADPNDFESRVLRAQLYREGGADSDLIAADAKSAMAVQPDSVAATWLYAAAGKSQETALKESLVDLQKPVPSTEDMRRLLEWDLRLAEKPRDTKTLTARSSILNEKAQYRLALRDAEAALAVDSSRGAAHLERIYALTQLRRTTRAAEALEAMMRIRAPASARARAYGYMAESELEAYRYEAALAYATQAIEAESSAERYQTRASILQRLGRETQAQEDLRQAKTLKKKP